MGIEDTCSSIGLVSSKVTRPVPGPQLVEQLPVLVVKSPILRQLPEGYPGGSRAVPSIWRGPLTAGLPLY